MFVKGGGVKETKIDTPVSLYTLPRSMDMTGCYCFDKKNKTEKGSIRKRTTQAKMTVAL